jgi:hypothetical protein
MEKATLRAIKRIALLCAAAGLSASAMAYTVPGGTITFRGALVAPPFTVDMQAATQRREAFTQSGVIDANAATVTFLPPVNSAPSANVSLIGKTQARFVDGHGRLIAPDVNGAWHVGEAGGKLSMQGSDSGRVTLVTNYN